jgi:hypothetical protein
MNNPFDEHFDEEEIVPSGWNATGPLRHLQMPSAEITKADNFAEQWADADRLMAHQREMIEDALRFGAHWGIGRNIHDEIHLERLNITPETARAALASFEAAFPAVAAWRKSDEFFAKEFADFKPFGISDHLRKGNDDMGFDRPGQIELHANMTVEEMRAKLPPIKLVLNPGQRGSKSAQDRIRQVIRERTTVVYRFNEQFPRPATGGIIERRFDEQGIEIPTPLLSEKLDGCNNAQMLNRSFRVLKFDAQGNPIHIPVRIVDAMEIGTAMHEQLERYAQIDNNRFYDTKLGVPYEMDGVLSDFNGTTGEPRYERDGSIMRNEDQCTGGPCQEGTDIETNEVTRRIRAVGLEGIDVATQFTQELLRLAHWNCNPGIDRTLAIKVKSEIDQLVGSVSQSMDRIRTLRQQLIGINVEGSHRANRAA